MIDDRREKGYRTGQIKGKDFMYVTGTGGMGGSDADTSPAAFRYLWWTIPAHRLAVLNTKLEIINENFEVYDRYLTSTVFTQTPQPYRMLLSTKPPVNDVVDSMAVKSTAYVSAGTGIGRIWVMDETMLPQPTDDEYSGKIYVIVDLLATGKAPLGDIQLNLTREYEAMRTKIYDYEARL